MSRTAITLKFKLRWFPNEGRYWAGKLWTGIKLVPLMRNEDKNIGGSLILDLRIWWRHVKTLYKVIPLKLFLDIAPSSSADIITRALRECFRGEFISFRFVSKQRKTSNDVGMSSLIFWLRARELRLSVCFNNNNNNNKITYRTLIQSCSKRFTQILKYYILK